MRILAALSLFGLSLLALAPAIRAQTPVVPTPDLSRLSEDHRATLRCAAAFAIVATVQTDGQSAGQTAGQSSGDVSAGWPPLSVRGKRFFADAGVTVMREAGIDRAAVRDLIAGEVRSLQTAADPDAALAALAQPCTTRLDAAIPPLVTPGLRQCAAIMTLAYDEIYAREGLSAAARDLKTLASVLSAREREALIASGKTGGEADRVLAESREAIAAEAGDDQGGIDKYEVAHCYTLAKPDEKTHY